MTKAKAVSQAEFARILKVSRSWVTRLKADGRLVMTKDEKKVLVTASKKRIAETEDPNRDDVRNRHAQEKSPEQPESPAQDPNIRTFQEARAQKEHFQALQAKAEYEKSIGQLVDIEQVRLGAMDVAAHVRQNLENLPDQLAPVLATEHDPEAIHAILADAFERVLNDMADNFKRMLESAGGE